jgi:hypothetical protein
LREEGQIRDDIEGIKALKFMKRKNSLHIFLEMVLVRIKNF